MFGDALDPAPVTIRCVKFWPLQPRRITMAPDGHIWFHPKGPNWSADFSAEALPLRALFVHEMVHVWQVQHGGSLVFRRLPFARYGYRLQPGKPFGRYGIEQQASMVEDAYRMRCGWMLPGRPSLAEYAAVVPFGAWA